MKEKLRKIPSVNFVLNHESIHDLVEQFGTPFITSIVRLAIGNARDSIINSDNETSADEIIASVHKTAELIATPSLKPVINATGIIIHTNLGRAVLGEKVFNDIKEIILGYSNLEYNLDQFERGHRNDHLEPLLKFITGAESAVVVNNNAAALILALNSLAFGKEVIISRGELIEIGGSFRIPDILSAAGVKMIEVGTTNKTRLSDYENAITENTALIFKAHKSNYDIIGFTEEASVKELADFSHSHDLPFLYDIGSGLLRKPENLSLENEPDVKNSLKDGADMVAFSGDKLLGGPQAGIMVGKSEYIDLLKKAPMMRALRAGKLTIAALGSVIRGYINDQTLIETIPLFAAFEQSDKSIKAKAQLLIKEFKKRNIVAEIVKSSGQCGGGTLPNYKINSYAVRLVSGHKSQKDRSNFAESVFKKLHQAEKPIIAILRQADILFDLLTVDRKELTNIAESVSIIITKETPC